MVERFTEFIKDHECGQAKYRERSPAEFILSGAEGFETTETQDKTREDFSGCKAQTRLKLKRYYSGLRGCRRERFHFALK